MTTKVARSILAGHSMSRYARIFFINVVSSFHWAWMDVKCRYRRSVIGPLWETINIFVMICGMAFVSGALFNANIMDIVAYIGLGIITWSVIVTSVNEGTGCFVGNSGLIKNSNLGIGVYVGRNVFRIFIVAGHHMLIYIIGIIFLPIDFGWEALLAIPGAFIIFLNALWIMPTLGLLCARYRDLEMVIRNFMQLTFFVTPIFWDAKVISTNRQFIVDYNPFYYFIEIIRAPLLGQVPSMSIYMTVFAITIIGYALLAWVYIKMRRNLAFYV